MDEEKKKAASGMEGKLFVSVAVSISVVVALCLISSAAAGSYAGLPSYDGESMNELASLLDGEMWMVSEKGKAALEEHFSIHGARIIETKRSLEGIDIVVHTGRSPFVLSSSLSGKRPEGTFSGKHFSVFLLYEDGDPVFCIHVADADELLEFKKS